MPLQAEELSNEKFEAAYSDFQAGQHESGLQVLLPMAEAGHAQAQYIVGTAYIDGAGVAADANAGLDWFLSAAEQGSPPAQTAIAEMRMQGNRVSQDIDEAWKWAGAAAVQGFSHALSLISLWYANGSGVEQDFVEAVYWVRLAAQSGSVDAMANFSVALANGQGISVDLVQAHKWANLAAGSGHPAGQEVYDVLNQMMTGAQIDQAGWLAGAWKPRELSKIQLEQVERRLGLGGQDKEEPAGNEYSFDPDRWYADNIESANNGNAIAQISVGQALELGMGVEVDEEQAYEWYQKAAEQGEERAQYQIGNLLNSGALGSVDVRIALEWWEKAANQNYAPAQFNSGQAHLGAPKVKRDRPQAYFWFVLAADGYLEMFLENSGPEMLLEKSEDAILARDQVWEDMGWWGKTKAFGKLQAWWADP